MPSRSRLGYRHKSGTGHHAKKRRTTPISAIPGRPYSNSNGLSDCDLPPPIPLPVTAAAPMIADSDHPVIADNEHPLVVPTALTRAADPTMNQSSILDTVSNEAESSLSLPLPDSRSKSELNQFRRSILTSASNTLSNSSPTSLCHYKSLLQAHMNLVDSKLNGSSIMSPPVSSINSTTQSTISSLPSEPSQESQMRSTSSNRNELTDARNNPSNPPVSDDAPTPQNLSHVFTDDCVDSNQSVHSTSYQTAWRHSKSIQEIILSCGNSNDDRSRALTIALKHKSLKEIVAQAGAIVPKAYVTAIHHQEQKTKMISAAKANGNSRKLTEDRQTFVTSNIVSIVSDIGNKPKKHELLGLSNMLGCSLRTARRTWHRVGAKRANLLTLSTDTTVKWSVKPRIVRQKKVDEALIQKVVDWVLRNSNVRESPIARDSLLIDEDGEGIKTRVPKLLLECSVRELHNELISAVAEGGLEEARNRVSGEVIISDTMLRNIMPPQIRRMKEHHKQMCGCDYCNTATTMQASLNAWRKTKLKSLSVTLESLRPSRRRNALEVIVQSYSDFVNPHGEERHSRASLAAASMMCAPTEEHGLPKWSCVLRKCGDCGPLVNHDIEIDISDAAPIIEFNTYLKQGYCSIHGVLPTRSLICHACDTSTDTDTVRGKVTFRKKLFKLEKKIGEFHSEYYLPSIEKLVYHRSYYKILGKNNVASIRQEAFQSSPGSIATRSDYAEKFSFAPDGQLQGEYFSNNRSLSMEGCCLDHFKSPLQIINMQSPDVAYVPEDQDVQRVFHSHFSDMSKQNAATTTKHLQSMLDCLFTNGQMVRGGTMYDTTDGCACQYRCSKAFFLLSVIAAGRRIIIDRAIDAPGHGKGVVDGMNAIDKGYLGKCLCLTSTPEVHNDERRMNIHSMNEEGEFSFAEECQRLCVHRDNIGMTGDTKHKKREAASAVKQRIYHVHQENDIMHMNLNIKAKFPKRDDNIKMRDLYHIRCDPDLGLGKCAMRRIPCACIACRQSLNQLWQSNVDADKQPRYAGHVVDCKYASIMGTYNKWYIVDLVVSDQVANESDIDFIEEVQETILDSISAVFAEQIIISNYGAFHTDDVCTSGYYIVQWLSMPYILAEPYICNEYTPPQIIPQGTFVCKAQFLNPLGTNTFWYHDPPSPLPVMVKMKQVIHANLLFTSVSSNNRLPHRFQGYKDMSPRLLIETNHDLMIQEISRREVLEYSEDAYGVDQTFEYDSDNTDDIFLEE